MAQFVHKNGDIKDQDGWRKYYKNMSIPRGQWTEDVFDALNIRPIFEAPMPTPKNDEVVISDGIKKQGVNYVKKYKTRKLTPDEITTRDLEKANHERTRRNAELTRTDFTQLADRQKDQDDWAEYRQKLRDVPSQEGFPNKVDWPIAPDGFDLGANTK